MGHVINGIFTAKKQGAGAVIALAASPEVDFNDSDLDALEHGIAYSVLIRPSQPTVEAILALPWFLNHNLDLEALILLGQKRWPKLALVGACRLEM